MTSVPQRDWIVCQIGAREHYALAAELHARGRLLALCTDIWAGPGTFWGAASMLPGSKARHLRGRYIGSLRDAKVICEGQNELFADRKRTAAVGKIDWPAIMARNRRFGARIADRLERSGVLAPRAGRRPAVFAYSYAALEILQAAKRAGCPTILGQIDPGPEEDALVAQVARRNRLEATTSERAPARYWEDWRAECALADAVVVNSNWSAELAARAGVELAKLCVVPLAYEAGAVSKPRLYPEAFSMQRPLRVLFLGQVCVRKGVVELLEAMARLAGAPLELTLVGPVEAGLFERFGKTPKVAWIGQAPRAQAAAHYDAADLFILPTHSDGFAITQLEAQAHALPLIASTHCGNVVVEGENGRLLTEVSADAIERLLLWATANPATLQAMSARASKRVAAFTAPIAVDAIAAASESRAPA